LKNYFVATSIMEQFSTVSSMPYKYKVRIRIWFFKLNSKIIQIFQQKMKN